MFGFKKKEKKVEDLVSESFDKVIELTKNGEHEAATKETDNFTNLLKKLPGNEKWEWYDKLTIAIVEAVNNSKNTDNKEYEDKESKLATKNDIDSVDDNGSNNGTETKVDGSETARLNKIKKTLIDPNPLYTKWMNYFWKNKLHDDAQAKKFCPMEYDRMFNQEHITWNDIDLTENAWNMAAGCIYGDIDPILNFQAVCTVGIRDEFKTIYNALIHKIDKEKYMGFTLGNIVKTDKEFSVMFRNMTSSQIRERDIRFGKCLISFDSSTINSLSIGERFILKKWEEFCPSSIYDVNPETDTEERYWERRNALSKVYKIFGEYTYYSDGLSNAFAVATEYFEFVEQNNK